MNESIVFSQCTFLSSLHPCSLGIYSILSTAESQAGTKAAQLPSNAAENVGKPFVAVYKQWVLDIDP